MLRGHRDLKVYQLAYKLAMEIFNESKSFPKEERYSLTDQIRRSSRSVATNIAEAFRKRQYPNMFVNKPCCCIKFGAKIHQTLTQRGIAVKSMSSPGSILE